MNRTPAVLLFGICATLHAAEPAFKSWDGNYLPIFQLPREKHAESFETLLASSIPSPSTAEDLATRYWFSNHGLLAEEGLRVSGLFRIGRDIKGFAAKGEWVWEVRVTHLGFSLDGVIWINAHSKKIHAFGPKS
ncbi:hypothetical protein [Chitinolyticbacter albus]|uniref:hypothetical protein n=1 Tax=Chitinolyticbacter albus TaxID=2961951 RepID=UPI00210D0F30|nr:hypothetical protein [Chitinolyticbacter albus]